MGVWSIMEFRVTEHRPHRRPRKVGSWGSPLENEHKMGGGGMSHRPEDGHRRIGRSRSMRFAGHEKS